MPTQSELAAAIDEWEDRIRSESRREARRKALVETIEGFCELLGIELTTSDAPHGGVGRRAVRTHRRDAPRDQALAVVDPASDNPNSGILR